MSGKILQLAFKTSKRLLMHGGLNERTTIIISLALPLAQGTLPKWYGKQRHLLDVEERSAVSRAFTILISNDTEKFIANGYLVVCQYTPQGNIVNAGYFAANVGRQISGSPGVGYAGNTAGRSTRSVPEDSTSNHTRIGMSRMGLRPQSPAQTGL